MIKEALQYLLSLRDVEAFMFNGHQYTNKQLHEVPEDKPEVFKTKTLASLVELIVEESNYSGINNIIVHVEGPTKVNVVTTLRDDFSRFKLYAAEAELPNIPFGQFLEAEKMNILLKSAFVGSDSLDGLVKLLGTITEESIKQTIDDGISQKVVAKTGIATVGNVTVNPIVTLIPYRTFLEVEQPESEFLLRLKDGPMAALFEADGGAWKIDARATIKAFFEEKLSGLIAERKVIVTE